MEGWLEIQGSPRVSLTLQEGRLMKQIFEGTWQVLR